jgi:hypothetical protein
MPLTPTGQPGGGHGNGRIVELEDGPATGAIRLQIRVRIAWRRPRGRCINRKFYAPTALLSLLVAQRAAQPRTATLPLRPLRLWMRYLLEYVFGGGGPCMIETRPVGLESLMGRASVWFDDEQPPRVPRRPVSVRCSQTAHLGFRASAGAYR